MNFVTSFIQIGRKLKKLWPIEYFNIGRMGAAILNIYWGFINFKNHLTLGCSSHIIILRNMIAYHDI